MNILYLKEFKKEGVEMEKASIFMRGQIWYWEDPLYGSKSDSNLGVTKFDSMMRFSRYALIIQDTTNTNLSAVVSIPISTSKHFDTDVEIMLPNNPPESPSYLRIQNIFPAHPKSFTSYVCTLSEKTMERIEKMLVQVLIPGLTISSEEPIETDDNVIPLQSKKSTITETKPISWTPKNIQKFVTMYSSEGPDAVSNAFNLSRATVLTYYSKFKKKQLPNGKENSSLLAIK